MAGIDKEGKVDPSSGPEGKAETILSNDPLWPWPEQGWFLFNFNIDGNVLKPEHKAFLDSSVIPFLHKEKAHVKLGGTASRSGNPEYNRQLSLSRILRVKKYLTDHDIRESQVPGSEFIAAGEDISTNPSAEFERDRSVTIVIGKGLKPRPIRVNKPDLPIFVPPFLPIPLPGPEFPVDNPPLGKTLHLQYITGASVTAGLGGPVLPPLPINAGVGGGAALHGFFIIDPDTGEYAKYLLPAGTGGGGVSPGLGPVSVQVTLPANNKPTPFVSNRTHVTDFDFTPAVVGSFGGGSATVNHLFLPTVGVSVPFESGTTIGAGGNGDAGTLILVESGVVATKSRKTP
jgi:hypothetical protein